MKSADTKIRIAIAGGGIGGLCMVLGLMRMPHLDVHVYEGTREYLDIGAGLALHPNAIGAMELVDPKVKQMYFTKALSMDEDPERELATEVRVASGSRAGETVSFLGKAKGRKTVARADLLEGFASLVDPRRLHLGKRMTNLNVKEDGTIELCFSDGTSAEADAVVGADGIHSVARSYIVGADHPNVLGKDTNWRAFRRQVPMEEALEIIEEHWLRNVGIFIGHGGYVNSMPLKYGKIFSATVVYPAQFSSDGEDITRFNKEVFRDFIPEVRNMVELIGRDPEEPWVIYDHDPAPIYYKDNVCMMGDAAHATTPFAGNGAAQAIEDAAVLTALFARITTASQIRQIFKAYDVVRRPRSQKVVQYSRMFGRHFTFSVDGVGYDIQKVRDYIKEGGSYAALVDLKAQNEAALRLFEGYSSEPQTNGKAR